ncbi:MAG: bifunctional phosphoribosylaminoimidazolecarboxamide formyltransferase/IMP cyclohydrolase [Alphaproteobacteria bacterium]
MAAAKFHPITRALISVSDKTGLVSFARLLAERGVEILSTGGSARALREAGVPVKEVAEETGFPEILDGRVKTLHPRVHGGILARRDQPEHRRALTDHGIGPIDLVVVNVYPFEAAVARGAADEDCLENIDIGGPALIRAAAKNHAFVTVVVDPADYPAVMEDMKAHNGATSDALRKRLAAAAFARTAAYDAAIARWFSRRLGEVLPPRLVVAAERLKALRYGENPHQPGALYVCGSGRPGVATAEHAQGQELSYNNIADADAAFELVAEFAEPAVAIVKHGSPCGVASGRSLLEAWRKALASDPVSAFGGVVALNRPLDEATAEALVELFLEVVIAPSASAPTRERLAAKPNLRLLLTGGVPGPADDGLLVRSVAGGLLVQARDTGRVTEADLKVVTRRAPTGAEQADLMFAFTVSKHVKSNAVVLARSRATVGIGAGQMSRVDAVRMAVWKAEASARAAGEKESRAAGAVVASDAFFPFPDGLIVAAEAGATAVIQPGGSKRDDDVIRAADEKGIAMVFTGVRHFRH